ncbi:MAG: hypothetical protein BGP24_20375 [Lysobacterales bacterium 69-70]|nr:hypothetical protein [Xanthomonadaceae bacterium]ODU35840.1 MAG: hypothetical protein ABS97_03175 [Xanthomonadaceae bacterium SCN 69-320]ODV17426.1 MAG: hypothetical protein ABT27_16910 [Xanthomonadaceae bacterium SCN 69-25]OJY97326.1 MAG: hypothetical protein BGP24_20375 [Xanthomonadales bacterium 69-70]
MLPYLLAASFAAADARACSCELGSLEEAVADAEDIALVTVREVGVAAEPDQPTLPQRARFAVNRDVKGDMACHGELRSRYGFGDSSVVWFGPPEAPREQARRSGRLGRPRLARPVRCEAAAR